MYIKSIYIAYTTSFSERLGSSSLSLEKVKRVRLRQEGGLHRMCLIYAGDDLQTSVKPVAGHFYAAHPPF